MNQREKRKKIIKMASTERLGVFHTTTWPFHLLPSQLMKRESKCVILWVYENLVNYS